MKTSPCVTRRKFGVFALCAMVAATGPATAQEFVAKIGHLESDQQSRHVHLQVVADLVHQPWNDHAALRSRHLRGVLDASKAGP